MRRAAHRLVVRLGAFGAVLILVLGAGLWRLMQGPIDLDRLTPYIEEALNRSGRGLQIAISGGRVGIDRETRQLDLRIEGVRISQSDGEPLAVFPAMSAEFSLGSLLLGRMAPTRLVVERPVLRFIRDEDGAIRFRFGDQDTEASSIGPDILALLAGPPKPDAPLGQMRRVVVRDATFVLDDRQAGRRWRAERVDASVERDPEGFVGDLSLTLPLGAGEPEFHASYRYSLSQGTLDLGLEIGAVEPSALASLAPELAPLGVANFPVSGTLSTRLNIAEATNEGLRLDLRLGRGSIRSNLLPEGSLALQQGLLRAVYAPETGELRLAKLDLDLGSGSALSVRGTLDNVTPAMITRSDPLPTSIPGRLDLTLADVPVKKFESLWPPSLSHGGRRWVLANVLDGVLDEAAVQLDLDVDPAKRSAEVVSAHGTMRYHDATVTYFRGLTPARKVSGTAALQDKRLVFAPTSGMVKSLQLTGGSLEITDLGAPVEWLAVDLAFAGPLQEVLETVDAKPLRYAHDIGVDPAQVSGRTETNIHCKLPLLDAVKLDQVEFGVKAGLSGAGIANVAMNRDLTDGKFAVEIARPGAHLQGNARFDGVPLNIDANLFFKPKEGARARYRVTMALNDEQRRRLAFDFFPDWLAGPVGVDLTYWLIDPSHAEAEAAVDLRSASMSVAEAGWKKPPGAPATARLVLDLYDERVTRLPEVEVRAAGLDGKFAVALASDGKRVDRVDVQHLLIGYDDVRGSVMRHGEGAWNVDLRGPTLDISHWIGNLTKADARWNPESDSSLEIDAQVGRLILGPRREVRDFRAQLLREGADWRAAQIDARFVNGHRLSLVSGYKEGGRSLTFRSDDLGSALSVFDITDNVVGGRVTVTGQVSGAKGKKVVNGHIEGKDYSLVRAPVFARLLSLPSFSGVGSMLSGSGIPFGTLRGDFALSDNHLVLENLLAYGEAIGATTNGTVDLGRDQLDLQGTIVPAYALNSIIGNIPLIGSLLLGGEGQGLFAANYRLTGSAVDPQVSVNPLSALTPGFLRRLLQPNFGMPPPVQQSLGVQ
jgi:AsmA-like C-terminal region/Protein of unknown function